jgi:hypothetical protein
LGNTGPSLETKRYESWPGTRLPFDVTNVENAYEVPINEILQSSASVYTITVNYVDGRTSTDQLSPAQL